VLLYSNRHNVLAHCDVWGSGGCTMDHRSLNTVAVHCAVRGWGWEKADRGHGHGWYVQGGAEVDRKQLIGCLAQNGHARGIHVFGTSSEKVRNVVVEDCILDATSARSAYWQPAISFGAEKGGVTSGCALLNSHISDPNPKRRPVLAGAVDANMPARGLGDLTVAGNRVWGGPNIVRVPGTHPGTESPAIASLQLYKNRWTYDPSSTDPDWAAEYPEDTFVKRNQATGTEVCWVPSPLDPLRGWVAIWNYSSDPQSVPITLDLPEHARVVVGGMSVTVVPGTPLTEEVAQPGLTVLRVSPASSCW